MVAGGRNPLLCNTCYNIFLLFQKQHFDTLTAPQKRAPTETTTTTMTMMMRCLSEMMLTYSMRK